MKIETPTSFSDLVSSIKSSSDETAAERFLLSWVEANKTHLFKEIDCQLVPKNSLLEKELELLKKENAELKEKVASLSESVKICGGEEGFFATKTPEKKRCAKALFSDGGDQCVQTSPNKCAKGVKEEPHNHGVLDPLPVKSCMKWRSVYEMLIDFERNPELFLEGLCVLYRKQTEDEKKLKCTIYCNGRGFSQQHAPRGSTIAEFLIGGDPLARCKKTLQELKEFDQDALMFSMDVVIYHQRQLFEIYENGEDRFFNPSCIHK